MSNAEFKRGRLSHAEMTYIRENLKTLGIDEVSRKINRSIDVIDNFARQEGISYERDISEDKAFQKAEQVALSRELKNSPEWDALKEEFTENELDFFQHRYGKMMSQFKDDVLASEETQIFHLLKFEILMQRNMKGAKRAAQDIRRMEKEISKLVVEYEGQDMPKEVRDVFLAIETQLLSARSAQASKSSEYVKLQEKHSAILKELKATRDQRISRIEDSAKDILGLLKEMQDTKFRNQEGRQQALVNLAVEKEHKRLSEYHQYEDKGLDRPILSAETISDED
jgi:hypothetical protein